MRVLVTGASGFVGSRLARHLAGRGAEVTALYVDRRPEDLEADLVEVNLLDEAALRGVVRRARPEAVVHLAGLSHVGESWQRPAEYFQVNVLGTENVLRAAGDARVVLASSAEVYGVVPEAEQPIVETRTPSPRSPYALTKAAAERLALAGGGIVVRSFNLVGPGQSGHFALPGFAAQLADIAAGRQPGVLKVGNLEARRDFLHVDDGVEGYRVLTERGERGGVYNLGSGVDRSIREALEALQRVSGVEARLELDLERVRPVDLPVMKADNRRLRELGWTPRRTLEEALADLWAATWAERRGDPASPEG